MFEQFDQTDPEERKKQRRRGMRGMFGAKLTPLETLKEISDNDEIYAISARVYGGQELVAYAIGGDMAIKTGEMFFDDIMAKNDFDHIGKIKPSDVYKLETDTAENVINELETQYFGDDISPMVKKLEDDGFLIFYDPDVMWDLARGVVAWLEWYYDVKNEWDEDYDDEEEDEEEE
jgi:hypothetical protein